MNSLRYDSPTQVIFRTALRDINLSGRTIPKGKTVHCILGAANREPTQFPNPDKFDITRHPNRYLSFGHGIHTCLGTHLAKLEAQIAVGTLVRRLPRLTLATQSLEWEETFLTHGLKSLPVVF